MNYNLIAKVSLVVLVLIYLMFGNRIYDHLTKSDTMTEGDWRFSESIILEKGTILHISSPDGDVAVPFDSGGVTYVYVKKKFVFYPSKKNGVIVIDGDTSIK